MNRKKKLTWEEGGAWLLMTVTLLLLLLLWSRRWATAPEDCVMAATGDNTLTANQRKYGVRRGFWKSLSIPNWKIKYKYNVGTWLFERRRWRRLRGGYWNLRVPAVSRFIPTTSEKKPINLCSQFSKSPLDFSDDDTNQQEYSSVALSSLSF